MSPSIEKIYALTQYIVGTWPNHPDLPKLLGTEDCSVPEISKFSRTKWIDILGRIAYELGDVLYDEGGDFAGVMDFAEESGILTAQELADLLTDMKVNWDPSKRNYSYSEEVQIDDDAPFEVKLNGNIVFLNVTLTYYEGDWRPLPFEHSVCIKSSGDPEPIVIDLDEISSVGALIAALQEVKADQPITLVDRTIVAQPK